jgi:hypothetical protein
MSPRLGLTPRVTDCQSQCDFDFDFEMCVTHVEMGSNTSTVTLRVIGGDEKGSLKSERVKYGRESQGTQTQERLHWQRHVQDRPVLLSEGAPYKNKTITVKL